MFVDPLPEHRYVLHNDVWFRGVARNITGGEQLSFGINDRYGSSLLTNCIDQQDTMAKDWTLEHASFQMIHRRFNQFLIGILLENRQDVLLNAGQQ